MDSKVAASAGKLKTKTSSIGSCVFSLPLWFFSSSFFLIFNFYYIYCTFLGDKFLTNFTDWESHDAHVAFMKTPEYAPFIQKILEWSPRPTFYHAALSPHPPTEAFTSPVTEVAKLSVTVSKEEWLVLYEKFEVGLKIAPGYRAHSAGWMVEKEKDFVLAIGWDSVEAHTDWVKSEAGVKSVGYVLGAVGDHGLWHIRDGGAVTSLRP